MRYLVRVRGIAGDKVAIHHQGARGCEGAVESILNLGIYLGYFCLISCVLVYQDIPHSQVSCILCYDCCLTPGIGEDNMGGSQAYRGGEVGMKVEEGGCCFSANI